MHWVLLAIPAVWAMAWTAIFVIEYREERDANGYPPDGPLILRDYPAWLPWAKPVRS